MAFDKKDIKTLEAKELPEFCKSRRAEMVKMKEDKGGFDKFTTEDAAEYKSRNDELSEAQERLGTIRDLEEMDGKQTAAFQKSFKTPVDKTGRGEGGEDSEDAPSYKSLGEAYTTSAEFENYLKNAKGWNFQMRGPVGFDIPGITIKSLADDGTIKATMTRADGWDPYPSMSNRAPVLLPFQEPMVADLIPSSSTTESQIVYWAEKEVIENAGWVAEGAAKPEAKLEMERRTVAIEKLAVMLPITEEQRMDVSQVMDYVNARLTLMLKRKEEDGLLNGDGDTPEILGFHNVEDLSQITRAGDEDNPDPILRAITEVNSISGYANVSGIIMNPQNWMKVRLLRSTAGDYIWGHPSLVGPSTIWGYQVVSTNAETAGKALLGDFRGYSQIHRRTGLRIDIGYINDDFQKNIERVRLEERLTLLVYRGSAFCEVLSLN